MRLAFLILFFCTRLTLFGQDFEVICGQKLPKLKLPKTIKSEEELKAFKLSLISQLHEKGFLTANIDSVKTSTKQTKIYTYLGNQYKWSQLKSKNIDEEALNYSGFKEKFYNDKTFSVSQHNRVISKIIEYYEDNGYPFSEVFLDSVKAKENTLSALLVGDKKTLIKIDSIIIKSAEEINLKLLENLISIKQGDLYSEKKMRLISNRILESGLFKETEQWQVIFSKESTKLYLFLKSDKSSQFNGIAGIQPDPITNKISVTGDINLHLKNALKRAENIGLEWKKFGEISQELEADVGYPYILNSQFGTDLGIHLYKRDSSFLENEQRGEIQYLFSQNNLFRAFTKRYTSNTISSFLSNEFSNISTIYYGLGLRTEKLNYRLNPIKGYYIDLATSMGNKTTNSLDDNEALLEQKSLQGLVESEIGVYIPIGKKSTIKIANSTHQIINDSIYENELFRFGGLKTMRGFDEESLSASFYSISTLEIRYLFEQNSNAYIFFDAGFMERNTISNYLNDLPIGTGVGVNFETGAGIFTLSYALGKLENSRFQFQSAKIHFGFVAVF